MLIGVDQGNGTKGSKRWGGGEGPLPDIQFRARTPRVEGQSGHQEYISSPRNVTIQLL